VPTALFAVRAYSWKSDITCTAAVCSLSWAFSRTSLRELVVPPNPYLMDRGLTAPSPRTTPRLSFGCELALFPQCDFVTTPLVFSLGQTDGHRYHDSAHYQIYYVVYLPTTLNIQCWMENCTKFGPSILSIIIKIVATTVSLKCRKGSGGGYENGEMWREGRPWEGREEKGEETPTCQHLSRSPVTACNSLGAVLELTGDSPSQQWHCP